MFGNAASTKSQNPFLHCRSSDLETNPGIRASSIDARGVVGYCASLASLAVTSAILEDRAGVDVDLQGSGLFAEKW
jgi:hypothetical protein